jgi:hypothetical protein
MPYRSLLTALAICLFSFGAASAEDPVVRGKESFLLSGDATTGRTLIGFATGKPNTAYVIAAPRPDRMLVSVHPAADGLYVLTRRGAQLLFLRIPAQADGDMAPAMPAKIASGCRNCRAFPVLRVHQISDIALPDGTITAILADPRTPGISIVLEQPGAGRKVLRYDPSVGQFISGPNAPLM